MCDRWLGDDGFANFCADMGPRPEGTTLDRIDPDGDYEPNNCRWATNREQAANRKTTHWFLLDGEYYTIRDLSEKYGVKHGTIERRLERGWSIEQAVTPVRTRRK